MRITFGWEPGHIGLHTTLKGPWPHYMNLKVSWDGLWTLSFGLSQFYGHRSWLVCAVALRRPYRGLLCELIHRHVFIPKVNYPLQRLESLFIYLKMSAIYYDLNTSVSCMFWKDYTEYEILCHLLFYVTMVTFWMVLHMNKWADIVIDDGWVHPLAKTLPSLVSKCCHGWLKFDENLLGKW